MFCPSFPWLTCSWDRLWKQECVLGLGDSVSKPPWTDPSRSLPFVEIYNALAFPQSRASSPRPCLVLVSQTVQNAERLPHEQLKFASARCFFHRLLLLVSFNCDIIVDLSKSWNNQTRLKSAWINWQLPWSCQPQTRLWRACAHHYFTTWSGEVSAAAQWMCTHTLFIHFSLSLRTVCLCHDIPKNGSRFISW